MSTDFSGLNKLSNKLSDINQKAKKLEGTHEVSFNNIFTESFMVKHTNVASFNDFLEAGNFIVNSSEDFEAISDEIFNEYVSKTTDFDTWEDMLRSASKDYFAKELGF